MPQDELEEWMKQWRKAQRKRDNGELRNKDIIDLLLEHQEADAAREEQDE